MDLPKDNLILLSLINTKLRDEYSSLSELCAAENLDGEEVEVRLSSVGYKYSSAKNSFVEV